MPSIARPVVKVAARGLGLGLPLGLLMGLVAALAWGGCVSPTLPLPPPGSPDSLRALEDGRWEVRGDCNPGAQVVGIIERTGEGAVVEDRDADGRFRFVLEAERCDVVLLTQSDGDEVSESTRVVLVPTSQGRVTDGDGGCSR